MLQSAIRAHFRIRRIKIFVKFAIGVADLKVLFAVNAGWHGVVIITAKISFAIYVLFAKRFRFRAKAFYLGRNLSTKF